jgi:hypothetical protein
MKVEEIGMILCKTGKKFVHGDTTFMIGDYVYGLEGSAYNGLVGTIRQIRTEDDKETDNPGPDIYVDFQLPVMEKDRAELKTRFSALQAQPVELETINLDSVIMSPCMISPFNAQKSSLSEVQAFALQESWANGIFADSKTWVFSDIKDAQRLMRSRLAMESEIGLLTKFRTDPGFVAEDSEDEYRCWLDNRYDEAHYCLKITSQNVYLSAQTVGDICNERIRENRRDDFYEEICQWEEVEPLTDEQFRQLMAMPNIAERIQEKLKSNTSYWEAYYQSLSEASYEIVKEFLATLHPTSGES